MIPVSNVEITYLCDGVAKEFPFPYEYYDKSHVVGFVIGADGITTKITTNFTFNEVSKKFIYPVEGTALTSGNKIKLRRITELSQTLDLPNEYPFGNIEKAQDKLTMIMQELNYIGVTSIPEVEQSLIDKLNTIIINTNTVKEYEAYALQHRNDAETFKNNASSSASNALTSANNAKTSEDNAKLSETNAKTSETNAKTSETNVTNTINQAVADAVSATTAIANNAKLSEDKAKASELNAKTSENNAKTSELNAQNYATQAKQYAEQADIPSGIITMWSGASTAIPAGWLLCNGLNGTPDLRDRFVLGAGGIYQVGGTGGEVSHTLSVNEMPNHSHDVNGHAVTGGNSSGVSPGTGNFIKSITTTSIGGGLAHNNMPPYYALCYIMKQ